MSVMAISYESLGNVRKTLGSVSIREGSHAVNVCKCLGLSDRRDPDAIDRMFNAIDEFVNDCLLWNRKAYGLRYGGSHEPTANEYGLIRNSGEKVSKAQLFMTLSCIDYNSDIRDYMKREEYEKNPFIPALFENWKKKMDALIAALAESIAWEKADNEGCKWG